jgi:5-methylcytosine-specific restriction protein A
MQEVSAVTRQRPTISSARRTRVFVDNDGVCHICHRPIALGEPWHVEHVKARGFRGSDEDENLRPAHIDCHAGKTRTERKAMAKADAARAFHLDTKPRPRRPFPGGRDSRFKKKVSGEVILR